MHVRVSPPAVATALRDTFRLQGLGTASSRCTIRAQRATRDARLAITSAIGKWKTRFPQADAQLIDYGD
jgi:hypothetical protein